MVRSKKLEPENDLEVSFYDKMDENTTLDPKQKGKLKKGLRLTQIIQDVLDRVSLETSTLADVESDAYALGVINKADMNRFYNIYINGALKSIEELQKFNNMMLAKVTKRNNAISPENYIKYFLDLKKIENEHVRLINEMRKSQEFTLDQSEREILVIYRSLTPELKTYFFKVILEFIKQCPEIQKAMLQTNQQMMESNPNIKEEILKQREQENLL